MRLHSIPQESNIDQLPKSISIFGESFIASVPLNLIALGFRQKNVAKKLHDDGLLLNVEPYLQYLPTSEKLLGAGML